MTVPFRFLILGFASPLSQGKRMDLAARIQFPYVIQNRLFADNMCVDNQQKSQKFNNRY